MADKAMVPWNRHPLRCGIPGRVYSKYDFVQPIVDCIMRLHEPTKFNFISSKRPRAPEEAARARGHAQSRKLEGSPKGREGRAVLCEGCHTTDVFKIEFDFRNGVTVCQCGVASRSCIAMDEWSSTHNSADGKTTARADQVRGNLSEKSIKQRQDAEFAGTRAGVDRAARKNGFSAASKIVAGRAAVQQIEDDELGEKYFRKLGRLMIEVAELLRKVAPVDEQVARRIRMFTENTFRKAVKHRTVCGKASCQMSICDRPVAVLSAKFIMYALEDMTQGDALEGVSTVSLAALHGRVQSNHIFSVYQNATQHESIMAVISELKKSSACEPCGDITTDESVPESLCDMAIHDKPRPPPVALVRSASEIEPSKVVALRDAISKLSSELKLAGKIRDNAIGCLNDNAFSTRIKTNSLLPKGTPRFLMAYVVLKGVAERMGSPFSKKQEETHAAHLNVENAHVDSLLGAARARLPEIVSSFGDEDDFFKRA